jgi:hypothetical protein
MREKTGTQTPKAFTPNFLREMIVGGRKTVPQQALFVKKMKFNKKVTFDVISNDTFLLNCIFF